MKKIFLDLGAHVGESIEAFMKYWEDADEFEILSLEPSAYPKIVKSLMETQEKYANVLYTQTAAWTHTGTVKFYDTGNEDSSILKEKCPYSYQDGKPFIPREVSCIDISEAIRKEFSKDDYIIVKMDIEGGEYAVLEKMVNDGTMEYIDKLYCELHGSKCGKSLQESLDLLDMVESTGHKLYTWCAETLYENHLKTNKFYTHQMIKKSYKKWAKRGHPPEGFTLE